MACSFYSSRYATSLFNCPVIIDSCGYLVEQGTFPFYRAEDVEEERYDLLMNM
jgi:hypothetical protein